MQQTQGPQPCRKAGTGMFSSVCSCSSIPFPTFSHHLLCHLHEENLTDMRVPVQSQCKASAVLHQPEGKSRLQQHHSGVCRSVVLKSFSGWGSKEVPHYLCVSPLSTSLLNVALKCCCTWAPHDFRYFFCLQFFSSSLSSSQPLTNEQAESGLGYDN